MVLYPENKREVVNAIRNRKRYTQVETTDLIRKLRKIEIRTRGLSRQVFAGEYHSAFKGRGISFSEVREYVYGDDIRTIDWNVTARLNNPFVKVYEEERELTVMLLVDVSGSGFFGTDSVLKRDMITEIAALLSFSAIANNDKIGVMLFSDVVEKFIPPKKGKKHILRIIREILDFKPQRGRSSLDEPLRFITNALKKRAIVFVISDFLLPGFFKPLQIAASKHDVVGIRVYDQGETSIADMGLIRVKDPESGNEEIIDTSSAINRESYSRWWNNHSAIIKDNFSRCGVDLAEIGTDEDYVKPLIRLFKRR